MKESNAPSKSYRIDLDGGHVGIVTAQSRYTGPGLDLEMTLSWKLESGKPIPESLRGAISGISMKAIPSKKNVTAVEGDGYAYAIPMSGKSEENLMLEAFETAMKGMGGAEDKESYVPARMEIARADFIEVASRALPEVKRQQLEALWGTLAAQRSVQR